MSHRTIPRYKLLPDGIKFVVDSDPDSLCKRNGRPNLEAIARAACIDGSAFSRIVKGVRPWAGYGTVRSVSSVAAKARNISVEEAERMIFAPIEDGVTA